MKNFLIFKMPRRDCRNGGNFTSGCGEALRTDKNLAEMRVKFFAGCIKTALRQAKYANSAFERFEMLLMMLCRKIALKIAFSTKIQIHSTKHRQKRLQNVIINVKNGLEMDLVTKK